MIYVIHVQSGKELDIVTSLEQKEITAYAPRFNVLERRKGKWNTVTKIIFPGYVFIDIDRINDTYYYLIKSTSGVVRFLGNPIASLQEAEETRLRWIFDAGIVTVSKGYIQEGRVHITDGILTGREHYICKYNIRHKRCTLHCTINGKEEFFDVSAELEKI